MGTDVHIGCDIGGWCPSRRDGTAVSTTNQGRVWSCHQCDYDVCCSCSGEDAQGGAGAPSQETAALTALLDLASQAKTSPVTTHLIAAIVNAPKTLKHQDGQKRPLQAVVDAPVVRGIVSQGHLAVCGAAATAGALNAVREHLVPQPPKAGWKDMLYGQFKKKLGLTVTDADGDPASWKIGKGHIRRVLGSHQGITTTNLIGSAEAAPGLERAAAWDALVKAVRRPGTAVYMHNKDQWGHYSLVAGVVGPDVADGRFGTTAAAASAAMIGATTSARSSVSTQPKGTVVKVHVEAGCKAGFHFGNGGKVLRVASEGAVAAQGVRGGGATMSEGGGAESESGGWWLNHIIRDGAKQPVNESHSQHAIALLLARARDTFSSVSSYSLEFVQNTNLKNTGADQKEGRHIFAYDPTTCALLTNSIGKAGLKVKAAVSPRLARARVLSPRMSRARMSTSSSSSSSSSLSSLAYGVSYASLHELDLRSADTTKTKLLPPKMNVWR